MQHVQIQTAQNVGIAFELAGLGDRVLAALLDYLIVYAFFITLMFGLLAADVKAVSAYVIVMLPVLLYFLLCEVFLDGQSIGKKALRLKVVRLDGGQPTLGGYLLRWLLRPIDIDLSSGLVGVISILATQNAQRLGDLAAGTTVVKLRARTRLSDTVFSNVEIEYTPVFHQVEALTPRDVETAKEVLQTLIVEQRSPTTQQLGRQMKAVLEHKMGLASELPPLDFLRTVIADYNGVMGRL